MKWYSNYSSILYLHANYYDVRFDSIEVCLRENKYTK